MKYYKDDIVEILNYGDNYKDNMPYKLGERYTCIDGSYGIKGKENQINIDVDNTYMSTRYVQHNQIRLYYRPIKNSFKSIFNL